MIAALEAFGTGLLLGLAFALLGLPIPAPPVLAGVAGIAGITLAYIIIRKLKGGT